MVPGGCQRSSGVGVGRRRAIWITLSSPRNARSTYCPALNSSRSVQRHTRTRGNLEKSEVIVTLADEFVAVALSFAEGRGSLDELDDWLASHVQAVADHSDDATRDLINEAWFL